MTAEGKVIDSCYITVSTSIFNIWFRESVSPLNLKKIFKHLFFQVLYKIFFKIKINLVVNWKL